MSRIARAAAPRICHGGARNAAYGTSTTCLLAGSRQIGPAVPGAWRGRDRCRSRDRNHDRREDSGLGNCSELTSGKDRFPTCAARRFSGARTVLAVKGSRCRANHRRALDRGGPSRREAGCDGRLRRENDPSRRGGNSHPPAPAEERKGRFAIDSTAGPRRFRDCARELSLPMRRNVCFEAGRKTQTQSSVTANRCSRKWMSDHATALAHRANHRQIAATTCFGIAQRDPFSAGHGKP